VAIIRLPWVRQPAHKTVFVLGGGGNLGAVQVGMLHAAIERGIVPDEIVGCSAGAINAAALACDPTLGGIELLRRVWSSVGDSVLGSAGRLDALRLLAHRGPSLQPNDGLRRLLETSLPHHRFEDLDVPLHVVATSLRTGRERWFSSSGDIVRAVLASAALPGVLPPVVVDGELLIDGAVVDNVPISRAYDLGADRVVVFHVGNFQRARPLPKRPIDVIVQALSIARGYRSHLDTLAAAPEGVELIVLPGIDPGKLRYNDFSRSGELVERGRTAAGAFLDLREATTVVSS
jgi:NTE family protein